MRHYHSHISNAVQKGSAAFENCASNIFTSIMRVSSECMAPIDCTTDNPSTSGDYCNLLAEPLHLLLGNNTAWDVLNQPISHPSNDRPSKRQATAS